MRQTELQRRKPAEAVTQAPGREQQAREHERVRVDDPLELARARAELVHDARDRDVEDRVVDDDDEQADVEDEQDQPAALVGVGRDLLTHARRRRSGQPCAAVIASSARSRAASRRVHQRQAHVGRGDSALRVQHGLEHRRVGLGEARLHHREQRFVVRASLLDLPGNAALEHGDEPLGAHVRRRADRARRRREYVRERRYVVVAAEHREVARRAGEQLERSACRPPSTDCLTPTMFGVLASSSIPAVSSTRPVRAGML